MGGKGVSSLLGAGWTSAAGFVDAGAADVSHPFYDIVVTVIKLGLKHLQVAHLQTRRRKGNLQRREGRGLGVCWGMLGAVGYTGSHFYLLSVDLLGTGCYLH